MHIGDVLLGRPLRTADEERERIGLSPEVIAVEVLADEHEEEDLAKRWQQLVDEPLERAGRTSPKLVVLRSDYKQLLVREGPPVVVVSAPWDLRDWMRR